MSSLGGMSTATRAQRVAEIVEEALERDPSEHESFIQSACNGDAAVRSEVESLLGYRAQAEGFIEQPAIETNAAFILENAGDLNPGDTVGQYQIRSLLGEGGMGEVYLAHDTSLGREVALKFVKRGFGRANLLRHFHHEERILAGLNHPNIARLYGAGVADNGVPYFVMEHVAGERLDQYCDKRRLALEERLQLFRKICSAVAYAHRHLIIHRDLKPANIRVTPEGEPKLLDFGIAKLLEADESNAPAQTITLAGAMTPEYASPEQIRGDTMTTASDIYSLGVVLYELLTGRGPYRLTSHSADEVSRAITTEAPVRPSQAVMERARQIPPVAASPIQNPKALRGDLDNIVMMALRKEPERRYASVTLLSEDIRRHLEGRPVTARKDTWSYRTAKFIGRNKVGVVAAVVIALALVGGIIATSWQARVARLERAKADQRFNDVRKLANAYLFEFHDAIENLPGSTPARALLVKRALEYLDSLAREAGDDVSLQREVVMAYLKVGNVQGNPQNANLGDSAGALASYHKALAIAERWPALPDSPTRRPLALVYEKTADVLAEMNRTDEAVETARKSLAIFKEIAEANPTDAAAQLSVAISHLKVGDITGNPKFVNAGDREGAMQNYRAAETILQGLHAADPANPRSRRFLGMIYERMGAVFETLRDMPAAQTAYERSAEIRVPMAAEFPNDTNIVRDGAIAYEKLGDAMVAAGKLAAALDHRQKALEMFRNLLQVDPKNVHAQQSLAVSHIHLADLLGLPGAPNLGRAAEAEENYRRAIALLNGVNRTDARNASVARDLAEAQRKLATLTEVAPAN